MSNNVANFLNAIICAIILTILVLWGETVSIGLIFVGFTFSFGLLTLIQKIVEFLGWVWKQ